MRLDTLQGSIRILGWVDTIWVIAAAIVGVALGLFFGRRWTPAAQQKSGRPDVEGVDQAEIDLLLSALPGASIVVDPAGKPVRVNDQAVALNLIHEGRIAIPEIDVLADEARREKSVFEYEVTVNRPPLGTSQVTLRMRAAPLGTDTVLVLVEDLSEAQRVDAVRRDFVANVSHELKTPIGALSLLAEAVLSSSDEPEAVRHFAGRMEAEAGRLSDLVGDLIDLSRLQGADPLKGAHAVAVDTVVAEAVDNTRLLAQNSQIEVVTSGESHLVVLGNENHLTTALRNLLTNAINYSPRGTRVSLVVRQFDSVVEISVTDQGMGIPEAELQRVFERFYRVDQARSRVTGGTGLGLAIVKHVAENHGGEVVVSSVLGEGSTFTLRLPHYPAPVPVAVATSTVVEKGSSE